MKKLFLAVLIGSFVMCLGTSTALAATPTLKSLAKSVVALQKKTKTLTAQLTTAKATIAAQGQTIASLTSKMTADETTIAGHTQTLTSAASLLAIAPYVSLDTTIMNGVKPPNIVFKGANVHVMSATSETDSTGTGNLIVGWDTVSGTPARNGSNNLVAGDYNNFNSYAGFVTGIGNSLNQHYCSVSGGTDNTANAEYSSISGGGHNTTNGFRASISGGGYNTASSSYSSVSGGTNNSATADSSSVSGGQWNVAAGQYTSILGGGSGTQANGNVATGIYSAIVGGQLNSVPVAAQFGVVCGGFSNSATANFATVGGGYGLTLGYLDAWGAGGGTQTVQYLTKMP